MAEACSYGITAPSPCLLFPAVSLLDDWPDGHMQISAGSTGCLASDDTGSKSCH